MSPGCAARWPCWRVKGYDTSETVLACYGGAGLDSELRAEADRQPLLLIDVAQLYGA